MPVKCFVANCGMVEINHPHSPSLAPADVFLFLKVKMSLKSRRLQDISGLKKTNHCVNMFLWMPSVTDLCGRCVLQPREITLKENIQCSSYFMCTSSYKPSAKTLLLNIVDTKDDDNLCIKTYVGQELHNLYKGFWSFV
jgi:hypothetical protein